MIYIIHIYTYHIMSSTNSAFEILKSFPDLTPKIECKMTQIISKLACINTPQHEKIRCLENSLNEFNKCIKNIKV